MKTLSHNFSDVAELRQGAKSGRVRIDKLNEILSSYALGERELPANTKQLRKDGAAQPATRSESDTERGDKPQPEADVRSR